MFCKYCGKELADDVKFCSSCGKQLLYDAKELESDAREDSLTVNEMEKKENDSQTTQEKVDVKIDDEKSVATKKFCENCGEQLVDGAKFCLACGTPVASSNSEVSENQDKQQTANRISQFETKTKPAQYQTTQSPKSRLVAALLAFFLGEFGAHRFYVGKTGSAIVQILLSFSFIVSLFCFAEVEEEIGFFFLLLGLGWVIWVIIDFVRILCGSFKDKNKLPLVNWDF